MRRSNGGVVGTRVVPSASAADGLWGAFDQAELSRAGLWARPATFALTSSAPGGSVSEGQTLTITLTTTGVRDGTVYPYAVTGSISAADLTAGSLTGNLVINAGQAQTSFTFANDFSLNEGDESLLFSVAGQSLSFTVVDSSVVTYQLTRTAANINEGDSVTITLSTVNGTVPNGFTVPYTVTGINAADLSAGSLTGNFTLNSNTGSVSFTLANDATTEGTETMTLSAAGQSIQVGILDTSVTPLALSGQVSYYTSANTVTTITVPSGMRGARIHMWGGGGRNDGGTAGGGYMRGQGFFPDGITGGGTIYAIVGGAGYRSGSGSDSGFADPDGKCKASQGWTDTGGGLSGVFSVNPRSGGNASNSASLGQIMLVAGGGGAGYGGTPGAGGYPNGNGGSGTGGGTQSSKGSDAGNGSYHQDGGVLIGTRRYGSSGTYAGGGGYYPGGTGCNYGGASGGGGGGSGYVNTAWTLQDYLTGQTGTTPIGSGKQYYNGSYGGGTQQGQIVIEWMN